MLICNTLALPPIAERLGALNFILK